MFHALTVLALLGGTAQAGDPAAPPAPAPAATTTPPVDCATLTGDAKLVCDNAAAVKVATDALAALGDCTKLAIDAKPACDAKTVELKAKIVALTPAPVTDKASKATRSNTNRMEVENADE